MSVLLNGTTVQPQDLALFMNRGFRYGDGCFETILALDGLSPLLSFHLQRLQKSLQVLQLQWPQTLKLEDQLLTLTDGHKGWQRVRLWIWRAGDGLYTPQSQEAHWMLATEATTAPAAGIKASALLSQEVTLAFTKWSFIKSISALPYVQAGLEKSSLGAQELFLLNGNGFLTEATAANLFFKKRKRWYTPALSCGCISGVMRNYLMQQLLQKGEPVFEVHAQPEELLNMDKLVCTNVAGLQAIAQYEDKQFNTDIEELWSLVPAAYQGS